MRGINWSVCVITDHVAAGDRDLLDIVRAAIAGGATMVQLREKTASTRALIELGQALHTITQATGIPLIVNDRVDVALAIGAEGIHVGQDDMPVPLARQLIGPRRILGVSVETVDQAFQAEQDGADYLGVGPVYQTPSKADASVPIGTSSLFVIAQSVALPTLAIGGITAKNTRAVIQAGAAGIAVIGAIVAAADPQAATHELRTIIDEEYARKEARHAEVE